MRTALPSALSPHILSVLEALGCAGFFLDIDGRVLSLNALARSCLSDGLMLSADYLSATDREADHRLRDAIRSCFNKPSPNAQDISTTMVIAVPRHERLPLMIRLFLLPQLGDTAAVLLLLALDPESRPEPSCGLLSQAFGLTQTEGLVAIGVASGKSLSKIAASRGVKIGTVRAHLKAIFSKTHTRGQADLTRVLTRLALFMPLGELPMHKTKPSLDNHRWMLPYGETLPGT
jgi:DNA-binding CsgD family transcriptional regulator